MLDDNEHACMCARERLIAAAEDLPWTLRFYREGAHGGDIELKRPILSRSLLRKYFVRAHRQSVTGRKYF